MDSQQNVLSLFCLVQLAATLYMGLLLEVNEMDPESETSNVVFSLVVFLQAMVVFIPIIEVGNQLGATFGFMHGHINALCTQQLAFIVMALIGMYWRIWTTQFLIHL